MLEIPTPTQKPAQALNETQVKIHKKECSSWSLLQNTAVVKNTDFQASLGWLLALLVFSHSTLSTSLDLSFLICKMGRIKLLLA